MKKRTIWTVLTSLMVVMSLVLASCSSSTAVPTSTTTTTTTTPTSTLPASTTSTMSTSSVTTLNVTTTSTGNWWDSLGTPQYGGTINIRINQDVSAFDPYLGTNPNYINSAWMESLTQPIWTMDPATYAYQLSYCPPQYYSGDLAQSWEYTDPQTLIIHVRQGVYWQNIAPANGREFTAADVVYHFDRQLGMGDGFTKPSPYYATTPMVQQCTSITATDQFTVVFKFNISNAEIIDGDWMGMGIASSIECSDAVAAYGNLNNWHDAIGTGPFILTDWVDGTAATLTANPNYWGYDERYPQNKLPYVDKLVLLVMPSDVISLAALRTGKIDAMDQMTSIVANQLKTASPEISQFPEPYGTTLTVDPKDNTAPFNNILVREALQKAIDLPTIASAYYNGEVMSTNPADLVGVEMTGWGYPYSQWPQSLKNAYSYDPTAAKQLLVQAGYPNGFKTDIALQNNVDLNLYEIVQSYFAAIGVNMAINLMDPATWQAYVLTGRQQDGLAARNLGFLGQTYDPDRALFRFQTGYQVNYVQVSDPTYDAFIPEAATATSLDAFSTVVGNACEYAAQKQWVISLLEPENFAFCQPWLKGFTGQNSALEYSTYFFYTARWWIIPDLK